jgi:hypothetical protein
LLIERRFHPNDKDGRWGMVRRRSFFCRDAIAQEIQNARKARVAGRSSWQPKLPNLHGYSKREVPCAAKFRSGLQP